MKLLTYNNNGKEQLAMILGDRCYNMQDIDTRFPDNMIEFLWAGETLMTQLKAYVKQIEVGSLNCPNKAISEVEIMAPVPNPTSCRDAYAFRQHVASARKNRGVDMIPEFDQFPIFYFTNHNAVTGPGKIMCMPDHFQKLDFELEIAVVIGKRGRNIKAKDAHEYIAGYTIMNDMSARLMQMEEMKLNLGPAKGKDFSTTIGPWLVTPDELEEFKVDPFEGHVGHNFNLEMTCAVNGVEVSKGNMNTMFWTFEEIIERCSYGAEIFPGDVIGSGTVGTGCFLELNGTAKLADPNAEPQWLKAGDKVSMEITGLGQLNNEIVAVDTDLSLLAIKHMNAESNV